MNIMFKIKDLYIKSTKEFTLQNKYILKVRKEKKITNKIPIYQKHGEGMKFL